MNNSFFKTFVFFSLLIKNIEHSNIRLITQDLILSILKYINRFNTNVMNKKRNMHHSINEGLRFRTVYILYKAIRPPKTIAILGKILMYGTVLRAVTKVKLVKI